MSEGCCAVILFLFLFLLYLLHTIVSVFVVPIEIDCSYNNNIPVDAAVNISMEDWIYGGMWAGIIMFVSLGSGCKGKDSDCSMVLAVILYFLYNIFVFIWSIIGLTMYSNYYG